MSRTLGYVYTVDFARGIAAIGVMFYHLLMMERIAAYERVAYYCVYAFFVISGFSLYIVYRDRMVKIEDVRRYAAKRFWRIAPLFYLVCALQIALVGLPPDTLFKVPLNLSLAFGLANPGASSMIMGGWSIGIELVFYVLLPFVLLACQASLLRLMFLSFGAVVIMVLFVNHTLSGYDSMEGVWVSYTQPIAFFGYFTVGCLIGEVYVRYNEQLKGRPFWIAITALALLPFMAIQVASPTELLKGWVGLTLMGATMFAVAAVAFIREPSGALLSVAAWLGRLSYSIYLFHPIVYAGIISPLVDGHVLRIGLTVIVTLGLSSVVYIHFENRFRVYAAVRG